VFCFAVLVMEKFDCACRGGFLSCFEAEGLGVELWRWRRELKRRVLWSLE